MPPCWCSVAISHHYRWYLKEEQKCSGWLLVTPFQAHTAIFPFSVAGDHYLTVRLCWFNDLFYFALCLSVAESIAFREHPLSCVNRMWWQRNLSLTVDCALIFSFFSPLCSWHRVSPWLPPTHNAPAPFPALFWQFYLSILHVITRWKLLFFISHIGKCDLCICKDCMRFKCQNVCL